MRGAEIRSAGTGTTGNSAAAVGARKLHVKDLAAVPHWARTTGDDQDAGRA